MNTSLDLQGKCISVSWINLNYILVQNCRKLVASFIPGTVITRKQLDRKTTLSLYDVTKQIGLQDTY